MKMPVRNNSNMTFVNWFPTDKVEYGTLFLVPQKNNLIAIYPMAIPWHLKFRVESLYCYVWFISFFVVWSK